MAKDDKPKTIEDLVMPKDENPERWNRWIAHLQKARAQRPENKDLNGVSPRDVFDQQLQNGEFNTPKDFK